MHSQRTLFGEGRSSNPADGDPNHAIRRAGFSSGSVRVLGNYKSSGPVALWVRQ